MSLDTKYIAAAPNAETRMVRVWELLNKMHSGLPPRLVFYADEVLSTPGWRWAPRSLLGSSVKDSFMEIDERVLRLVGNPSAQGIPTPLGCMALIQNIHDSFEHDLINSREFDTGLKVHRTRTVIMSPLSNEEIRMMTIFKELATVVAADQETPKLLTIKDRDSEEWKSCMSKIKTKMKEVVAGALESSPELSQTIKNTIGHDMEEYMWAFIPKIFSHNVVIQETPSEQIWFVD
ncbi:hypothetical protein ACHAQJ_009236 [Trichoderma viride]